MAKNTSIALSDHFNEFVTRQVQSGHYGNASEVVRAGLRLLEEHEARMERLRAEIRKGEESGWIEDFDIDGFFAGLTAGHEA
jgi:antitoxin ParD1/3/4